jgi:hypothetical protein
MPPYVRTVRTASGATAVQIVFSFSRGSRKIEHLGSAHDEARLELLKAAARQRLAAGQGELDLGLPGQDGRGVMRAGAVDRGSCGQDRRGSLNATVPVGLDRRGVISRAGVS